MLEKLKFENYFPKIGAIARTTTPVLGLFVLILMHFSCQISIWQWKFKFQNNSEKLDNFGQLSTLEIYMERDSSHSCKVRRKHSFNSRDKCSCNYEMPLTLTQLDVASNNILWVVHKCDLIESISFGECSHMYKVRLKQYHGLKMSSFVMIVTVASHDCKTGYR